MNSHQYHLHSFEILNISLCSKLTIKTIVLFVDNVHMRKHIETFSKYLYIPSWSPNSWIFLEFEVSRGALYQMTVPPLFLHCRK